jgi:hypothetical protein
MILTQIVLKRTVFEWEMNRLRPFHNSLGTRSANFKAGWVLGGSASGIETWCRKVAPMENKHWDTGPVAPTVRLCWGKKPVENYTEVGYMPTSSAQRTSFRNMSTEEAMPGPNAGDARLTRELFKCNSPLTFVKYVMLTPYITLDILFYTFRNSCKNARRGCWGGRRSCACSDCTRDPHIVPPIAQ